MDSLPPLRTPPADLAAEGHLLGHLIANRGQAMVALTFLGPQHFADPINGIIYATIERFLAQGLAVSLASMRTQFERTGELAEVGGVAYLAQLYSARDEAQRGAAECARAIHDRWIERLLLAAGSVC